MKAVRINPYSREVTVVEGDIDELMAEQIVLPHGMVDYSPGLAMVVCPLATLGAEARLFWHVEIADFFGGICFVISLDPNGGGIVSVPPGAWLRTRRAVEFLGGPDEARTRLCQLVEGQMRHIEPADQEVLYFGEKP